MNDRRQGATAAFIGKSLGIKNHLTDDLFPGQVHVQEPYDVPPRRLGGTPAAQCHREVPWAYIAGHLTGMEKLPVRVVDLVVEIRPRDGSLLGPTCGVRDKILEFAG